MASQGHNDITHWGLNRIAAINLSLIVVNIQFSKSLPVGLPEANNFGGGMGTFLLHFIQSYVYDSRFKARGLATFFDWIVNTAIVIDLINQGNGLLPVHYQSIS